MQQYVKPCGGTCTCHTYTHACVTQLHPTNTRKHNFSSSCQILRWTKKNRKKKNNLQLDLQQDPFAIIKGALTWFLLYSFLGLLSFSKYTQLKQGRENKLKLHLFNFKNVAADELQFWETSLDWNMSWLEFSFLGNAWHSFIFGYSKYIWQNIQCPEEKKN